MIAKGSAQTVGRRKAAVARVILSPGSGTIKVNSRELDNYFPRETDRIRVLQPLAATETADKYDVNVLVNGGGLTGQADAVRLGIARALVKLDEARRPALRAEGLMTRDPRAVERKKYGRHKARRRPQYSKR